MTQDYGFKVSPPGVDVKTALDKDLAFTSRTFGLKILAQGTLSVTSGGGSASATVAHGLSYAPSFVCFPKETSNDALQINESNIATDANGIFSQAWSDTTNLNVKITNAGTMVFKYYIFVEDAD